MQVPKIVVGMLKSQNDFKSKVSQQRYPHIHEKYNFDLNSTDNRKNLLNLRGTRAIASFNQSLTASKIQKKS